MGGGWLSWGLLDWRSVCVNLHFFLKKKLCFVSSTSIAQLDRTLQFFVFLQVERYVDRQVDKIDRKLNKAEHKARRWYDSFINNGPDKGYELQQLHLFVVSFAAGVALGIASG